MTAADWRGAGRLQIDLYATGRLVDGRFLLVVGPGELLDHLRALLPLTSSAKHAIEHKSFLGYRRPAPLPGGAAPASTQPDSLILL